MTPVIADNKLLRFMFCAALLINIVLATVLISSPDKGHSSGIEGKVLKFSESQSSAGAVEAAEACPRALFVILDAETKAFVTRGTTDEAGCFNVRLEPSRYIILLEGIGDGHTVGRAHVREVKAGRLTEVTIYAGTMPAENKVLPAASRGAA